MGQRTAKAKAKAASWRANTSARTRPAHKTGNWEAYDYYSAVPVAHGGPSQLVRDSDYVKPGDPRLLIRIRPSKQKITSWHGPPKLDSEHIQLTVRGNQTNLVHPGAQAVETNLLLRKAGLPPDIANRLAPRNVRYSDTRPNFRHKTEPDQDVPVNRVAISPAMPSPMKRVRAPPRPAPRRRIEPAPFNPHLVGPLPKKPRKE